MSQHRATLLQLYEKQNLKHLSPLKGGFAFGAGGGDMF